MAVYHKNLKYHDDKTEKHKITDDELSFLRDLQKELNAQDILGQANPRFWVIKGTEKLYHVEEADGYELYDSDNCEVLADTTEEICNYINENLLDEINDNRREGEKFTLTYERGLFGKEVIVVEWLDNDEPDYEETKELEDLHDIKEWLSEQGYNYEVVSYKIVEKIYENTMFLTQVDAENHLRANHYHYSEDAHTYAMTAWRAPRMNKLIEILQEVEW